VDLASKGGGGLDLDCLAGWRSGDLESENSELKMKVQVLESTAQIKKDPNL